MEEEVREHLKIELMKNGFKERITAAVKTNEGVLFHLCMLTANIVEEHAQASLDMLVDLWITIWGYAFASTFLEMYNQGNKKQLQ